MWASVLSELSLSDVASWFNASTISSLNLHNSEGWACIVYIEQSEAQSQKKFRKASQCLKQSDSKDHDLSTYQAG